MASEEIVVKEEWVVEVEEQELNLADKLHNSRQFTPSKTNYAYETSNSLYLAEDIKYEVASDQETVDLQTNVASIGDLEFICINPEPVHVLEEMDRGRGRQACGGGARGRALGGRRGRGGRGRSDTSTTRRTLDYGIEMDGGLGRQACGGGARGRALGGRRGRGGRGRSDTSTTRRTLDYGIEMDRGGGRQACGGGARGRALGGRRGRGGRGRSDTSTTRRTLDYGILAVEESKSTLSSEIQKNRAYKKKNLNNSSPDEKSKLLASIEAKEVGRFMMPDSPQKKRKRKSSPIRVSCPLKPGTPEKPPPRIPRPWEDFAEAEAGQSGIIESGEARVPVLTIQGPLVEQVSSARDSPAPVQPVSAASSAAKDCSVFVQTGSSSARYVRRMKKLSSKKSKVRDEEIEISELELELSENVIEYVDSGSEEEVDPLLDDGVPFNIISRNASQNPDVPDESLSPDIINLLNVMDIKDSAALREIADADMLNFNWTSDPDTFRGTKETFTGEAGPTFSTDGLTPLEIFEKFFDQALIDEIVCQTNAHAHNLASSTSLKKTSRLKLWKDVTKNDIWTFFGVLMLQSLVPHPVESEYWYPKSPYLQVGDFKNIMPYKQFLLIKRCLHFVDNKSIKQLAGQMKKLAKIQPIIDHLNDKFSSLYVPEQCIAIDESLLLWKGRLSFVQLINNKAAQTGIKSYELCESRTGYLWKMIVYGGKGDKDEDSERDLNEPQGTTSQIVYDLVRPLLNKGHVLVMDNFYNSPLLSRTLKKLKTDTMGTLRIKREFVPESLKNKGVGNMEPGEVAFSLTDDLSIVAWRDNNKIVSLISTFHKVEVSGKEKFGYYKYKPQVVLDYNLSMGGVDKKDQLLQAYPLERIRNSVWYKKLFRRLLNVCVHNAYIIANHQKNIAHRDFRRALALEVLKKYCARNPTPNAPIPIPVAQDNLGHFPIRNKSGRARCKWCAKSKVATRTVWKCEACDVDLCILGCFKNYHISKR